jgi:peptide/histidine transporter 3/4
LESDIIYWTEECKINKAAMDQLPTESTHLLQQPDIDILSKIEHRQQGSSTCFCNHFCLPSKAAILIILWTAAVGAVYNFVLLMTVVIMIAISPVLYDPDMTLNDYIPYAILAVASMLYPLSGFIADVYCGRLRVAVISLCFILGFVLLICFVEIIGFALAYRNNSESVRLVLHHEAKGFLFLILVIFSLVTFIIGLAGYQANMIQLGLDQFFEAPSQYLSLFIMYAEWAFRLGPLPLMVFVPLLLCNGPLSFVGVRVLTMFPFIIAISIIVLLIITRWKRHWFYLNSRRENPYKTVSAIINFARKHKYPLQRSAFTYCTDYIPSRLDFAKERYGGPFTTEQVENVKTFLWILILLFSIGPVFTLEVLSSYFIFPIFGFHTLHHIGLGKEFCTGQHTILGTGIFMHTVSTLVLFPIYVCITFSILHRKVQKMFLRMFIGATICFLGVTSLLIIDSVGHSLKHINVSNQTQCIFQLQYTANHTLRYPALDMHWSVLIPPSIFLGVGPMIITTATLEFISAQSPQSMKGFLIGIFFAIRGLFHFLNSIIIIPLSLKRPWASGEMIANPPVTNCGFVYLLFTCVVGLIGLILFSVAAKKYKYRRRNEGMFRQVDIEDIFEREIEQASSDTTSDY